MSVKKPAAAMAASVMMLLGVAALAQNGEPAARGFQELRLVEPKNLDWIEKSDVAAQHEGVIDTIELQIGHEVKKGGAIAVLHSEVAKLTVTKARLQAEGTGAVEKAQAQKEVAVSVVARNKRLNERKPGMVSAEDVAKAEGELNVAEAQLHEAVEQKGIATAEYDLAKETLAEHTIRAPFDGVVFRRKKEPGESVRAGDAIVTLGNLSRLCVDPYIPLEYAYRVKVGQVVQIRVQLTGSGSLPIEKKKFSGKVTFVSPELQSVGEDGVRIRAEFENPNFELKPGLMVKVTIFVPDEVTAAPAPPEDVNTRTAKHVP
jgi:RND family efflux transporter MFP subunit